MSYILDDLIFMHMVKKHLIIGFHISKI